MLLNETIYLNKIFILKEKLSSVNVLKENNNMKKLVLKFVKDLTDRTNRNSFGTFNPVCSDGYVHIKFRDYSKEQEIRGFESKMSYLVTYLMHYSIIPCDDMNIDSEYERNHFLTSLTNNAEYQTLETLLITAFTKFGCKGLKLNLHYSSKNKNKPFGRIPETVAVLNALKIGSIHILLETLGSIDITEFLFDDSITLHVARAGKQAVVNSKFLKKTYRKENKKKILKMDITEIDLWK